MSYSFYALISVIVFAMIHLIAEQTRRLGTIYHSRLLSTGSGVAIAYVFIDLLPKLSKKDTIVKESLWQVFPFLERHVYIMALLGFLLFFIVDRTQGIVRKKSIYFYLSLGSYALFNFLIGYAVVDKENPETQPLILFTLAMALHYLMNDYSLSEAHGKDYKTFGKWILIACLFLGWFAGVWVTLSPTAIALVSAFIGGGVIMNVTRHELPVENPNSLAAFLCATTTYTIVLLTIGAK